MTLHPIAEVLEPRDCSWCRQIDSKTEQLTNGGSEGLSLLPHQLGMPFFGH